MQGDDVRLRCGFLEIRGDGAGDERVGQAMEAVFPQAVTGGDGLVDGVGACWCWDSGVEGGVEEGGAAQGPAGAEEGGRKGWRGQEEAEEEQGRQG